MRFLAFVGVCLPLISGSPVDNSRSDLSPRVVTSIEKPSCAVLGYKPEPFLTRSRRCRLVDCRELCSVVTGCQSYADSKARYLLFSSPVAEGFQQDLTSPYTLYDLDCSKTTSSTTETQPEATNSANTGLSTSGIEAATTSNAQPSSAAATFTTEHSTEITSASTSTFSAESASASVSSDATSTSIIPSSNTEMSTKGEATTTTAGEPTTISSSTPTVYIIRLVNPDESTFGYVSSTLDHNRLYGSREDALEIQISAPDPGATSQLDLVHAEIFGGLTRLCTVQSTNNTNPDLWPDSSFYNSVSACTPTRSLTVQGPTSSPPANVYHAWSNWAALNRYTLAAESAIWNVDPDTLEVTASWINTDGSTPPITLFISESSNWIGMTGSFSAMQAAFPRQPYRRIKLALELI